MRYRIFKALFYLTTRAYFRSIYAQGKELLPDEKTPVIFVANHPSSFMDSIIALNSESAKSGIISGTLSIIALR